MIDTPSYAELLKLEVSLFRNRLADRAITADHANHRWLEVYTGGVADLHAHLRSLGKAGSPFSALGADLEAWGVLRDTLRRGATPASGESAGLIKGTETGAWGTTDVLVHSATGLRFRPTSAGSLGASGQAVVGVIALVAGSASALEAGEVLEWEANPDPGLLEDQVELQTALDDAGTGLDVEDIEEYRIRVIGAWQKQAAGGSPSDYERFILAADNPVSGIATAYAWRGRNGKGTVDVAALRAGSGAARLLDATDRTALGDYLAPLVPGPEGLRVLEVIEELTDVEYLIDPESGRTFARDWDDTAELTVAAYTPATRTLQLSAARPASLKVGGRLVVGGTAGEMLTVQSLVSTDSVVLASDRGYTISAAAAVWSGGGATEAARDAIVALIDSLGPRRGRYAAEGLRWFSTLGAGRLFEAVQTAEGVLDSEPESPVADVEPTELAFPDDAGVHLLTPGNIIVRYRGPS